MSFNPGLFYYAHKKLIAKSIEELQFEDVLSIEELGNGHVLNVNEEISYRFEGTFGIWNNIQINLESLLKYQDGSVVSEFTIYDFFKEIQHICKMDDDTLAKFLEEANQTIFSDLSLMSDSEISMNELTQKDYLFIEQSLDGHPKLIMNKGRIGWGQDEITKYAPEFRPSFQLVWIAVAKDIVDFGFNAEFDNYEFCASFLDESIDLESYFFMAVHPWQWNKYIKNQFSEEIACSKIIEIGTRGDSYSPQSSIRTLSSSGKHNQFDIKLSLSILNTSCVRGIPGKYISSGYKISDYVQKIIDRDDFLKGRVDVLREVGAIKVKNAVFDNIEHASYRYKELLGCIWRESVSQKLRDSETAIPTASLFFQKNHESFLKELIANSKISASEWLRKYFEVVVIPLYHLQAKHGLGLVSHGQNTILVLEHSVPKKLIIKDFHGDLRISKDSKHLEVKDLAVLDVLAPNHLIHDLITGHFITVLRYISRVLKEHDVISEFDFYKTLSECVHQYINDFGVVDESVDLLKSHFEKILVNKVRFVAGYNETSLRLKPLLGRELKNPLSIGSTL